MWTREELKTRGKAAFLRNYWICVVAALILTLLVGSGTSNSGNSNNDSNQTNSVGISGFTISSDNFNVESFAERFTPQPPQKKQKTDNTPIQQQLKQQTKKHNNHQAPKTLPGHLSSDNGD